jgi:hypothetical protein
VGGGGGGGGGACVRACVTLNLNSIYYAYFHSTMKYGIIFGGNSSTAKYIHFSKGNC